MKWKPEVKITEDNGLWLYMDGRRLQIRDDDVWIVRLMQDGVTEEDHLIRIMAKEKGCNAMVASLKLVVFVEHYGRFLREETRDKEFR